MGAVGPAWVPLHKERNEQAWKDHLKLVHVGTNPGHPLKQTSKLGGII